MKHIFSKKQTDLDINGPNLSFTTQPSSITGIGTTVGGSQGANVSITGVSTANFNYGGDSEESPTPFNRGEIKYQWYEEGVGKLSDDSSTAGTGTTTLTVSNLITPTDNGRKFFLAADYEPFAPVLTGNAPNEPLNSGIATVTVTPLVEVTTQPALTSTFPNVATDITVVAGLSDDSFGDDTQYQWQLDGSDVSDGTITKSIEVVGNIITQTTQTDSVFIIPANVTDIIFDCAGGSGGNGGGGGGYNVGGSGGAGLAQRFTLSSSTSERTVRFEVGRRGEDGQVAGHGNGATGASNGGDGGTSGNAGAGGGGGGSTGVYVDGVRVALLAGGGAGGGGGVSGTGLDGTGYDAAGGDIGLLPNNGSSSGSLIGVAGGGPGTSSSSEAGGGGGGAGTGAASIHGQTFLSGGFAGAGGSGAGGGYKGDSEYRSDILGLGNGTNNPDSNGWGSLIYTTTTTQSVTRTTTVSGATTNTLTLSTDGAGIGYVARCRVTSANASNSPIFSDSQIYTVEALADFNNIKIESIPNGSATAVLSEVDLDDGELTLNAATTSTESDYFLYCLYAPDKDVDVEVDLYGGAGKDQGWNNGGYGGYSRIRFTMKQNEEYVIAGLTESINTPYLYRKGTLIANVGEGGEGKGSRPRRTYQNGLGVTNSRGVDLGTVISNNGVFGASARDKTGSNSFIDPTLYPGDTFISGTNGNFDGGRTITCTKGVYWAQEGVSPCQDVPTSNQFRLQDGTVVSNTANNIDRGYKAGYNIIQTGGYNYDNAGGEGGNGAWGGYASGDGSVGGQGGAGYTDGSVTIISSSGSPELGNAKVILRVVT